MSDTAFAQPGETRWQSFLRNALDQTMQNIRGPGSALQLPMMALDAQKAGAAWLNGVPTPKVTPAAAADPLTFGAPTKNTLAPTAIAGGVNPKPGELPDVTGFLAGHLGEPVTITSGYRDPAHNADVGGVKNSAHTQTFADGSPMAYDFKPSSSSTKTAAIKLAQNLAGQFDQIIDEGDHVHVSFSPRGRGQVLAGNEKTGYKALLPSSGLQTISPTVQPGDVTHYPGMVALDPSQVGAMIPNPHLLPTNMKLPAAPQFEDPKALAPLPEMDKASLLAPLVKAFQVKPIDHSHDTWDRFAALLSGAAQGGVEAGRAPTMGQFLLNAGAGAARGFQAEKLLQKGQQDKYDEMVRQANIALAQQGFNIDLKNIDVRNQNIERGDTSTERIRQNHNLNATELFNQQLQQFKLNLDNARENVGVENQRDLARANTVVGATQSQAEAQNKTNLGQTELNLAGASPAGTEKLIAKDLAGVGVDPLDEKNPHLAGARQAAMGVRSNQVDAAFNGLAHDLVVNGGAQAILAPAKGDSPDAAKAKSNALKVIKTAKKPEDAQGAIQVLAQLFTSDHKAGVAAAKMFAARGYPSAKIIINGLKNSGMSDQDKKAYGIY